MHTRKLNLAKPLAWQHHKEACWRNKKKGQQDLSRHFQYHLRMLWTYSDFGISHLPPVLCECKMFLSHQYNHHLLPLDASPLVMLQRDTTTFSCYSGPIWTSINTAPSPISCQTHKHPVNAPFSTAYHSLCLKVFNLLQMNLTCLISNSVNTVFPYKNCVYSSWWLPYLSRNS